MADNLAQSFIVLRRSCLAAEWAAGLCLYHRKGAFDIGAFMIVVIKPFLRCTDRSCTFSSKSNPCPPERWLDARGLIDYRGVKKEDTGNQSPSRSLPASTPAPPPLVEGEDYYMERGFVVFTEKYLRARGSCCHSGCRHCPYEKEENRWCVALYCCSFF